MDNSLIDEIRRRNDIVEVIHSYIPLKRAGANYRGLCPFHNDTHPSLNVSPGKQIFKCFACGKAGNVFTFVQDHERVTFFEALKKLAARAGIPIPERDKPKAVSSKRELLLRIYLSAKNHYTSNLFEHGRHVLDYLQNRQISQETAKSLDLGYALNSMNGLKNYLLKEGVEVELLKECGLFGMTQGNLIDQFRDRLMFPIHNNTGDVIAFGGRILQENQEGGKYINSPGTELYTKGKELYGLYKTKYDIAKQDSALICEGYMDFLRLYESGFTNCAASLGTALTEEQIYLTARYSKNICLLYDGDLSGQKAAVRAALLVLSKGLSPRLVSLPAKEDPDSFLLNHGKNELQALIDESKPLIAYFAENENLNLNPQEKIEQIIDSVRQVRDPIQKEFLLKDVAEIFKVSEKALKQKLSLLSRRQTAQSVPDMRITENPEERILLILALRDKNNYFKLAQEINPDYFYKQEYKQIFKYLTSENRAEDLDEPARLLDRIEDASLRENLADLLFEDLAGCGFDGTLQQVKLRKLESDIEKLAEKIKEEPDNMLLFKQKEELVNQLKQISKKVVYRIFE